MERPKCEYCLLFFGVRLVLDVFKAVDRKPAVLAEVRQDQLYQPLAKTIVSLRPVGQPDREALGV